MSFLPGTATGGNAGIRVEAADGAWGSRRLTRFLIAALLSGMAHLFIWQQMREWEHAREVIPPPEKAIEVQLIAAPVPVPLPDVPQKPASLPVTQKATPKPAEAVTTPRPAKPPEPKKPLIKTLPNPPAIKPPPKPKPEVREIDELAPARVRAPSSHPKPVTDEHPVVPAAPHSIEHQQAVRAPEAPVAPRVPATPPARASDGGENRGETSGPIPLNRAKPRYPALARQRHIEGRVVVRFRVGTDGQPDQCEVAESSGHESLDAAARDTVCSEWRFKPAMHDGKPVARQLTLPIVFKLE